jgi:hypothetical protein
VRWKPWLFLIQIDGKEIELDWRFALEAEQQVE